MEIARGAATGNDHRRQRPHHARRSLEEEKELPHESNKEGGRRQVPGLSGSTLDKSKADAVERTMTQLLDE